MSREETQYINPDLLGVIGFAARGIRHARVQERALRIGSEEHKRLFCRTFVETSRALSSPRKSPGRTWTPRASAA